MKLAPPHTVPKCWRVLVALSGAVIMSGLWVTSAVRAAPAFQEATETLVHVYFFWGDGCPHCAEAKPFLDDLAKRYPQLRIESFEVYYSVENQTLFKELAAAHGFEPRYVPTIFIGDEHWEGFAGAMGTSIERGVKDCLAQGCRDAGAGVIPGHGAAPASTATPESSPSDLPEPTTTKVRAYLFYGDLGCSECDASKETHITSSGYLQLGADSGAEALAFLGALHDKHPDLAVNTFEVWMTSTNAPRFERAAEAYGVEAVGVPMLFIGDRVWKGFDADTAAEVRTYVERCLGSGCPGPLDEASGAQTAPPVPEPAAPAPAAPASEVAAPDALAESVITVPVLGKVALGKQSLWVSTALISFVDGFNPCSLWVLSVLIALSLRTGSRKRIFTIGLLYITVTAGVYVLFIAGLFTFMRVVSFLGWIQVAVSLLALFFAAVNIKDYFWYKEGISLTIADDKKPGIYKRMRRVMNAGDSFWALAAATVALGAGVSLVEFACTAGFPVIWTNLVASQGVAPLTFVLLLLLYMLIYQIDELAIFGVAVLTLKANRIEEKHGRILKLIGGTLMLALAGVMLINPALMNSLGSSLLIFGGAIVAALVIMVIHRRLLPRFGIHIGSELAPSPDP
ncbi:MAG: hypothetical protein MUF84_19770 [Anaerolineae bacterium]|nr:hypothetical protein [Anaerolineae bacterium]